MATVIGISFGNSNSSIAFEKDGRVDLIADQDGDRAIPSIISYVGADEYHGSQAKSQLIRNPKNTVANFRDFCGCTFDDIDPTYCHASAHPVKHNESTCFSISMSDQDKIEPVPLNKIVTRHFDRIRQSAADFIGKPIDGAVLTVPTNFTDSQRNFLVEAAKEAELKITQVINEPSAALLSRVFSQSPVGTTDKIYAVLDFGGTRSDGAVVAVRGGVLTILGTLHDYELGGAKLDEALIDHFAKEFEKQYKVDPKQETRALAKLKAEAEAVKKTLSNTSTATFAVESLASGYDFNTTINRLRFEVAARQVFSKFVTFTENLVKKAEMDILDIDEVLLVGGTSSVPKVVSTITSVFDAHTKIVSPLNDPKALPPIELNARGAAIQASLISGYDDDEIKDSLQAIVTVASHTSKPIGIKTADGKFLPVIDVDTSAPIRKVVTLTAPETGDALIEVYEGDSEIVTRVLEKSTPSEEIAKKEDDDDESDWSEDEDDEDEEIREKVVKPTNKVAELALKGATPNGAIEVVFTITKDLKLQVAARDIKGAVAVRGTV